MNNIDDSKRPIQLQILPIYRVSTKIAEFLKQSNIEAVTHITMPQTKKYIDEQGNKQELENYKMDTWSFHENLAPYKFPTCEYGQQVSVYFASVQDHNVYGPELESNQVHNIYAFYDNKSVLAAKYKGRSECITNNVSEIADDIKRCICEPNDIRRERLRQSEINCWKINKPDVTVTDNAKIINPEPDNRKKYNLVLT